MYVTDPQTDLTRHRSKIARVLLIGFAVLGLVAYVPGVWVSIRVDAWGIAILDTVVYAALLAALAFGRGRYWLQAGVVVVACYLLGAGLAVLLGPYGAGPLWLMATAAAAAILFDRREALAVLILVATTLVVISVIAALRLMPWSADAVTSPVLWAVLASSTLLLAAAMALAIITLIRGLQQEMRERHRAEGQLRHAEKLQAIGTLSAGIAHDFNNLLTPILSATEIARADAPEGTGSRAALDQVIESAIAGRELVQRILAFSRPTGDGRLTMLASQAFRDAVRLLRASIPGSVAVELQVVDDGYISLSPTEVHQIVLNLGTNAHKAMPGGGRLLFRLSVVTGQELGAWTAAAPRPRQVVRLDVTDTGRGMSGDLAARVFEPFFTTDPEHGSGIGLATVHGIVASVGGQARVSSQPGRGTTFTFDLPQADTPSGQTTLDLPVVSTPPPAAASAQAPLGGTDAAAAAGGAAAAPVLAGTATLPTAGGLAPAPHTDGTAPQPQRSRHILVVDDERPVRDVAVKILERSGYRVTPASCASDALDVLQREDGRVCLILTDLHMPGMTGLQLAQQVRNEYPTVALVLMSGLVDEALGPAAEIGVEQVIAKPFRLQELTHAVESALRSQD
jgi:signal transduction histidine kinase/ActR/RegA family two-component response regulator